MDLNGFWQGLLDILYPPREVCPLCGTRSPAGQMCRSCLEWLHENGGRPVCTCCGRFGGLTGEPAAGLYVCSHCLTRAPAFDLARAVAPYRGVLREAVLQLKSRGTRRIAAALAELMVAVARREAEMAGVDIIVPVPLAPARLARRGFNQAELLAWEVGRLLELPVETGVLAKVRETKPQAGLSRAERMVNLVNAFTVSTPAKVRGKTALVIDDVFTTGTTVENIAIKLRQAHAPAVFVLTAAGGAV